MFCLPRYRRMNGRREGDCLDCTIGPRQCRIKEERSGDTEKNQSVAGCWKCHFLRLSGPDRHPSRRDIIW
jgi:hypothetical protein